MEQLQNPQLLTTKQSYKKISGSGVRTKPKQLCRTYPTANFEEQIGADDGGQLGRIGRSTHNLDLTPSARVHDRHPTMVASRVPDEDLAAMMVCR
uniref:Uncharacterized protein n=1 Tax=Cucumis sativus TaxID=3659 RepID=A0A0A0LLS0_CUCSA